MVNARAPVHCRTSNKMRGPMVNLRAFVHCRPSYKTRGLMVNPSGRFMSVDFLKHIVDGLVVNKMWVICGLPCAVCRVPCAVCRVSCAVCHPFIKMYRSLAHGTRHMVHGTWMAQVLVLLWPDGCTPDLCQSYSVSLPFGVTRDTFANAKILPSSSEGHTRYNCPVCMATTATAVRTAWPPLRPLLGTAC